MKVGASKIKQRAAIVLGVVALFMVVRVLIPAGGPSKPAPVATSDKSKSALAAESLDPRLHLDLLANSEAVQYEGAGKNIFRAGLEMDIPAVKISPLLHNPNGAQPGQTAVVTPPAPPPPPPPPPINLKFFGFSTSQGEKPKAFLSQGDDVWIAHEGDVVNRQYRIVRITPAAVEVEDLLNSNHQNIRLTQG
jgi:hypothetical protein